MDSTEANAPSPSEAAPFAIQHLRLDRKPDGSFRPAAYVLLTPAFRTSGLLASLPAEDVKSLLTLLSFVTPNGYCLPSVQELAVAMGQSDGKVRVRMECLARATWRGTALAYEIKRDSGMDAYAPAPEILANVPWEEEDIFGPGGGRQAVRDAVIAHSREHYARPRAEVERGIAEFYGWDRLSADQPDASPPTAGEGPKELERSYLLRRLISVGISRDQAEKLMDEFPPDRIQRQVEWLPYRNARDRGRLLVSAIVADYAEPASLKRRDH